MSLKYEPTSEPLHISLLHAPRLECIHFGSLATLSLEPRYPHEASTDVRIPLLSFWTITDSVARVVIREALICGRLGWVLVSWQKTHTYVGILAENPYICWYLGRKPIHMFVSWQKTHTSHASAPESLTSESSSAPARVDPPPPPPPLGGHVGVDP